MKRSGAGIPAETLLSLRGRLASLPHRSSARRADRGRPRGIAERDLVRYCEIIAALKLRTTNRQGRHVSTVRAIELLEEHGVETPDGFVQAPKGLLKRTTVNHWLQVWEYNQPRLTRPSVPMTMRQFPLEV